MLWSLNMSISIRGFCFKECLLTLLFGSIELPLLKTFGHVGLAGQILYCNNLVSAFISLIYSQIYYTKICIC